MVVSQGMLGRGLETGFAHVVGCETDERERLMRKKARLAVDRSQRVTIPVKSLAVLSAQPTRALNDFPSDSILSVIYYQSVTLF